MLTKDMTTKQIVIWVLDRAIVIFIAFYIGYKQGDSNGFFAGLDEGMAEGRQYVTCPDCDTNYPVLNIDGSAPTDADIARIYGDPDPLNNNPFRVK